MSRLYGTLRAMFALAILACGASMHAQDTTLRPLRPVYSAYMLQGGTGHLSDTYLTPLHYDGWHAGFEYERTQAMRFKPDRWIMQLVIGLDGDVTQNPARNGKMYNLAISGSWRMMHRWRLPYGITAGLGPGVSLNAGALYSPRNGNNPASAKAAFTVDAVGYAAYSRSVWRVPVTFRYQATLPVTGVFFAPEYAQLYYQIYLGDRDHLVHGAWWGNYFSLDNLVSADLHFGATTLRIGYRGQIFSSKANNIVSNNFSHSFVLGICTEWLSLRPGRKLPDARIISAY